MFKSHYRIGESLTLRKIEHSFAPMITAAKKANRNHLPFLPWISSQAFTDEESLQYVMDKLDAWDRGVEWTFAIFWDETLIGDFQIRITQRPLELEMGYWLDYRYRLRGIMSSIVESMVGVFKALGVRRLVIVCDPKNVASVGLATKLNFRKTRFYAVRGIDRTKGLATFVRDV